jgi:hypothetical protein
MDPPPATAAQVRFLLMAVAAVACTNAVEPHLALAAFVLWLVVTFPPRRRHD